MRNSKLRAILKLLEVSLDHLMDNKPTADEEETDAVDQAGFFGVRGSGRKIPRAHGVEYMIMHARLALIKS